MLVEVNKRLRELPKEAIEPVRIERKLIHGQMVDVKIYPTMHPVSDLKDLAAFFDVDTEPPKDITIEEYINAEDTDEKESKK